MPDATYRYQAMTISKPTGTTYWNKSKPTLEQVYRHLDRYCHKYCDVLIYKYEVEYVEQSDANPISKTILEPLEISWPMSQNAMEHYDEPEEWNAVGDIKFIEMYEGFYPRAQPISEMVPDCEGARR